MRLIFAGTPEPAVVALERLLASDHEILAVLTRPDARKGRGRTLHPSPVSALAQEHGIEVLTPTTLKAGTEDGETVRRRLRELAPEAVPVVAYGNLIPADLLDLPTHGWVNLHFSLLPAWRGAAPVQASIHHGDTTTGATTFRIDEELDTGDILGVVHEEIRDTDTAEDLLTRLAHSGADLLVRTMDGLADGSVTPVPQEGEATYAHKITTEQARIDWNNDAVAIDRHIRAHTPGPGAWTMIDQERFKVGPVSLTGDETLAPGEVAVAKNEVRVGTGSVDVLLGAIQAPGKRMMPADDWARGLAQTEGLVMA